MTNMHPFSRFFSGVVFTVLLSIFFLGGAFPAFAANQVVTLNTDTISGGTGAQGDALCH